MTIPNEVLAFARTIDALTAEAAAHAATLTAMSEKESGPQALGYAALASELEQIGKVLRNYIPRLMKHVGELAPNENEVPSELADLVRENEPHGTTRERLWQLYVNAQSRIADGGKSMEPATEQDYALFKKLHPHLNWLAKKGSVEIV
jgi:hypothetical protein